MTPPGAVPDGPIGVAILGSTGSVGTQTLEVIALMPERFRVVALAAGANADLLNAQIARFQPDVVACETETTCRAVAHPLVQYGPDGLSAAATHPDAQIVIVATSGHAAIMPTYRAISAGKTIALANKETIVCAGALVMPHAAAHGVEIRPVDSEHSAIWQSLGRSATSEVSRLILTASGGPFRETSRSALESVTAHEAMAHPTWAMGGKITIDSATLMNKGLEVIEAHHLFGTPYDRIDVVVHPQSIVHGMVTLCDGASLAHMGNPDMRVPIAYALHHPERVDVPVPMLDLTQVGSLTFEPPDLEAFPSLALAFAAARAGGTAPCILNAANEVAVHAFLNERLGFLGIPTVIEGTLEQLPARPVHSFESLYAADADARRIASELVAQEAMTR